MTDMPRMLGEIVTRLIDEQDDMQTVSIDTVSGNDENADPNDRIGEVRPDVLLTTCEESEASENARAILTRHPTVSVISITPDGSDVTLFELRPHEVVLGEVSPESLIETIREVRTC